MSSLGTSRNGVYSLVPKNQISKSKKYFKPSFKLVTIVANIILLTAIILTIRYHVERRNRTVCLTQYCIEAAKRIQNNMIRTVDPCENFYEFSCGSWRNNTKISSNSHYESQIKKLSTALYEVIADLLSSLPSSDIVEPKAVSNARRLYHSCVNESAIEAEYQNINRTLVDEVFDGWEFDLDSTWNTSMFNLSDILLKSNQYNYFPFYHVETSIRYYSKSSSRSVILISPGYRVDNQRISFVDENLFTKLDQPFTPDLLHTKLKLEQTTNIQNSSLSDFEIELEKYLLTSTIENSAANTITTVSALSKTINTNFDFSNYIRHVYLLGNVNLSDYHPVTVKNIEAIRNISMIIAQQTPDTILKYIRKQFIKSQALHMPKRFRIISEDQKATISGVVNKESRTITCAKFVNKNMPFAVSKLYINKYFDKLAHNESLKIVENIRNTFIDMVNKLTWMDCFSKKHTIEKAQAMNKTIGYSDFLDDDNVTELENIYAEHNFNSSHMKNVLLLLQLNMKQKHGYPRKSIDVRSVLEMPATYLGAFYIIRFNTIMVPAATFQSPLFHRDAPKYLNYGAIGSIVGHEIAYAVDELNRHIDKDGKKFILWPNQTSDVFDKRSKCIVEQYNNYTVSQINRQVNGTKTLEENIADNDGLKKAFYAYQKWVQTHGIFEKKLPGLTKYSAEQMFFISFGQVWCSKETDEYAKYMNLNDFHSPSQFRVNGATSNSAEFVQAFGCKANQGNNRVNKCSVW